MSPKRRGDPVEHPDRMPFVVGILEPTDDGRRRTDEGGKFSLREISRFPKRRDLPSDVVVDPSLFEIRLSLGIFVESVMKNFYRISGRSRHVTTPLPYTCGARDSTRTSSFARRPGRFRPAAPFAPSRARGRESPPRYRERSRESGNSPPETRRCRQPVDRLSSI